MRLPAADLRAYCCPTVWETRRLWSLRDMINFQLRGYIQALEHLDIAKSRARARDQFESMPGEVKQLIQNNLGPIEHFAISLGMLTALPHVSRLNTMLSISAVTYGTVLREIEELWNSLDHDSYAHFFYHYPADRLKFLRDLSENWATVLTAFPSAKPEIEEGVDCYALGHNAACVFHMARVGEIGLRTIARERGLKNARKNVPLDWGTWGAVFGAIEGQLKAIRNRPPGPKKDAALAFYDTILSDLHAIQSLYRDRTMHLRKNYDDGEAQTAMKLGTGNDDDAIDQNERKFYSRDSLECLEMTFLKALSAPSRVSSTSAFLAASRKRLYCAGSSGLCSGFLFICVLPNRATICR